MQTQNAINTVWFVYDGDCPLCTNAALALRIKQQYGRLVLVNARTEQHHFLLREIAAQQLDLDDGMVIYDGQRFYHGKHALRFMAQFGEHAGWFNLLNKALFWSDNIASISYPWLRGIRNWLLKRHGRGLIDNLARKQRPIFQDIFGLSWHALPPVMQKHYRNRPYSDDHFVVTGQLDVMCRGPLKWLSPLLWWSGMIPPANARQVPVTVAFISHPRNRAFTFYRTFHFTHRPAYRFVSHMEQLDGNVVVEWMRFGIGWKTAFYWEDGCVKLKHMGYVLRLFGHLMPLPLTALIGAGSAIETPVDDRHFDMQVEISHPWWGKIYAYQGRFTLDD